MVAVATPARARLPIGRGRPGAVDAGIGVPPWLPVDRAVAWFRGAPTTEQAASADVVARTVVAATEAGVPVVGVLAQAGLGTSSTIDDLCGWGAVAHAFATASGQVPTVLVLDGPCLGGPALLLGLVDVVVMTSAGHAFVNAPATSARITGSAVLDAELVGGSWVHGARTGVADVVVDRPRRGLRRGGRPARPAAGQRRRAPAPGGHRRSGRPGQPRRRGRGPGRRPRLVRRPGGDRRRHRRRLVRRAARPVRHQRRDRPGPGGRHAGRRARQPAEPARRCARHRGLAEGRARSSASATRSTSRSSRSSTPRGSDPGATRSGGA